MASKISGISIVKVDEQKVVIQKNSAKRVAWWRVTLGKKITGSRKVRKFFPTERAAKEFVDGQLGRRKEEGHEAFAITPALRQEAKICQEQLDDAGKRVGRRLTLTEAVGFFLRRALPAGGSKSFADAQKAFIASRRAANLKERYIRNLVSQFQQLNGEFASVRVNLITSQNVEEWFGSRKQSPKTRNNYIITLRTFFDYCVKQKWCSENPAAALNKAKSEDAPAGILTVDEVSRLLATAVALKTPALPAMLVQLFAGLRRSEVCALDWAEVKTDLIEVSAAKSKTRSRRVVDMQPNLREWLKPHRQQTGFLFPSSEDVYNETLREVLAAANAANADTAQAAPPIVWKHNCLRHTCASMHLAKFANEAYTAMQMGHTVDILHRHYKGLVTPAVATSYWELKPTNHASIGISPLLSVAPAAEILNINTAVKKRAGLGSVQGTDPAVRASRVRSVALARSGETRVVGFP